VSLWRLSGQSAALTRMHPQRHAPERAVAGLSKAGARSPQGVIPPRPPCSRSHGEREIGVSHQPDWQVLVPNIWTKSSAFARIYSAEQDEGVGIT
jgi:hypothetical protein